MTIILIILLALAFSALVSVLVGRWLRRKTARRMIHNWQREPMKGGDGQPCEAAGCTAMAEHSWRWGGGQVWNHHCEFHWRAATEYMGPIHQITPVDPPLWEMKESDGTSPS